MSGTNATRTETAATEMAEAQSMMGLARLHRRGLLAAGLAGGAALAGGARAQGARKRVIWWYEGASANQQRAFERVLVQAFNDAQSQYELVMEYRGSGLGNQVMVALAANEGPDIVMTNGPSWTQRFVSGGKLQSLDAYAKQFGWEARFVPAMLDTARFGGQLYALPKNYETQVLYFNRTLFEANGWTPPKDKAGLEQVASAMLAKGITPIAGGNAGAKFNNRHYFGIIVNTLAGPEAVYRGLRGETPWTAEPFVQSVAELKAWWDKGWLGGSRYFSVSSEQAFSLMAAGRAGMATQGTWAFQWVPDSFGKTGQQLDWVPLPSLSASAPYPVFPLGIGANLAINASSKVQDGAAQVLDRLASAAFVNAIAKDWEGEWNLPLVDLIPRDPPQRGGDRSPAALAVEQRLETARAVLTGAYGYTPWTFFPTRTDDFLKANVEEVWLGRMTPTAFCQQLDEVFRKDKAEGFAKAPPPRA